MASVNRLKITHFYSVITYKLPILLGWWLMWANRWLESQHSGYAWANAFRNAWIVSTGDTFHYDYFRDPLYSVLLNGCALLMGNYAEAAFVLGWVIALVVWCVLCSIAFRLAGGLAVWILLYGLTQSPLILSMPVHANTYPLSVLAIAALVWASCRGVEKTNMFRWGILLTLHVLALCIDGRTVMAMPISGLVLFGMLRNKPTKVWLGSLAIVVIYWGPLLLDRWCALEANKISALDFFTILEFQREVVQRWATLTQDTRLQYFCADIASSEFLRTSFLNSMCGRATLTHNLMERWPMVLHFPWQQLMVGMLLSIVVLKGFRRLAVVYLLFALWMISVFIVLPPRYLLQLGPVVMILSVLGIGKLFRSCPWWAILVFGSGLFIFGLMHPRAPLKSVEEHGLKRETFDALISVLKPDDNILDCTSKGLGLSLYPEFPLLVRPERGSGIPVKTCIETAARYSHLSLVLITTVQQPDLSPLLIVNENSVFLYRFSANSN